MSISQNLQFTGDVPPADELDPPRGEVLARALERQARQEGWEVTECDNWRDCGWFFECRQGEAELQVSLAECGPHEWMLQVAPGRVPGMFGRWFGRKSSAGHADVLRLARMVHAAISSDPRCSHLRWLWNGPPDKRKWTSEPVPWQDSS
jgi:hypothetical protein